MDEVTNEILHWVKENAAKDKRGMEILPETSFLANNILDSLGFLSLVTFLEERFGVKVDEDDMLPENFESAESVAKLVVDMSQGS